MLERSKNAASKAENSILNCLLCVVTMKEIYYQSSYQILDSRLCHTNCLKSGTYY